MCTSLTYQTSKQDYFLARTMDFMEPLNAAPTFIPRDYIWENPLTKEKMQNKYAFLGAGSDRDGLFPVVDGVNEHGLGVAVLYFPRENVYHHTVDAKFTNLTVLDLTSWLLGNCRDMKEVAAAISKIRLVDTEPFFDFPAHWIISDATGKCQVLEPTDEILSLKGNPAGVMTNAPRLEWHLTNLNNYAGIRPVADEPQCVGNIKLEPFGQGSGSLGLPGDFTPPSRFVRAFYYKNAMPKTAQIKEAIQNIFQILDTVAVPKGAVKNKEEHQDITQYRAVMSLTERAYYFETQENRQIYQIVLTEKMINEWKKPKVFEISTKPMFVDLNV